MRSENDRVIFCHQAVIVHVAKLVKVATDDSDERLSCCEVDVSWQAGSFEGRRERDWGPLV